MPVARRAYLRAFEQGRLLTTAAAVAATERAHPTIAHAAAHGHLAGACFACVRANFADRPAPRSIRGGDGGASASVDRAACSSCVGPGATRASLPAPAVAASTGAGAHG
jgi:hypothetical protein